MKKVISILIMCFCLTGMLEAQNYVNNIQLQSVTDTVTRPIPINSQVTLRDSSRLYLITASQPVGTSMADIIAAGEYRILSNNKVRWDSIYATAINAKADSTYLSGITSNVQGQLNQKVDTTNIEDPAEYIDSVGAVMPPRFITVNDTAKLTDLGKVLIIGSESNLTFMLPNNTSVPFPVGTTLNAVRNAAGEVSITVEGGAALLAPGNKLRISETYQPVTFYKSATNVWRLWGALKE